MTGFSLLRREENTRHYPKGSVIFDAGDPAELMYVVIEGEVELLIDDVRIATIRPDEIFGEMALIDNSPRSATAMASKDSKLASIDQKRFEFLVQQTPNFAIQVMRVMAERLRKTTESSVQL